MQQNWQSKEPASQGSTTPTIQKLYKSSLKLDQKRVKNSIIIKISEKIIMI